MPYSEGSSADTTFLIIAFILFLAFAVFAYWYNAIRPFMEIRSYIITELKRSDDEEYEYWRNELKRLYKHYIPIIGRFLK